MNECPKWDTHYSKKLFGQAKNLGLFNNTAYSNS